MTLLIGLASLGGVGLVVLAVTCVARDVRRLATLLGRDLPTLHGEHTPSRQYYVRDIERWQHETPCITDEDIRRIERTGRLEVGE